MKADLTFEGIFLISASSGFKEPNYHYVKSFKVWDTQTEVFNNRFEDSHNEKALREKLAEKLASDIEDLIHKKSSEAANLTDT